MRGESSGCKQCDGRQMLTKGEGSREMRESWGASYVVGGPPSQWQTITARNAETKTFADNRGPWVREGVFALLRGRGESLTYPRGCRLLLDGHIFHRLGLDGRLHRLSDGLRLRLVVGHGGDLLVPPAVYPKAPAHIQHAARRAANPDECGGSPRTPSSTSTHPSTLRAGCVGRCVWWRGGWRGGRCGTRPRSPGPVYPPPQPPAPPHVITV
jgi:hypothetical protein